MSKDNSTDSYIENEILSPNYFCTDFYKKRKKSKYRLELAPDVSFPVADTHCHIEMFDKPQWTLIRCALHNVSFVACVVDSTDDGYQGINKVEEAYRQAEIMLPDVLERIKNEGKQVSVPVIIRGDVEQPEFCLNLDAVVKEPQLPELCYIVGTHPHYAKDFDSVAENNLYKMLKNPKVRCVGEIGLDYHYDLSPHDVQVKVFKRQLEIANELKLPVALHLRESHEDALKVFEELGFNEYGTLLHCFNLGSKELKPWVDAGCYVALGGPVTFKNSDETRDAVGMIPKDKLLSETDAPFMTPEPLRGDTCFPDHVIFNVAKLCEVTDNKSNKEQFYRQLLENTKSFFEHGREE